jgi:hypothetical protein
MMLTTMLVIVIWKLSRCKADFFQGVAADHDDALSIS